MLLSIIQGLVSLTVLFVICCVVVLGFKAIIIYLLPNKKPTSKPQEKPQVKTETAKPKRKPIKTIYINPDEVDRICVKKTS